MSTGSGRSKTSTSVPSPGFPAPRCRLFDTLVTLTARINIAVELVGTTIVVAHGVTHPSDVDWQIYLNALRRNARKIRSQLIVTEGGSPNANQRKASIELVKVLPGGLPKTAVVTSSVLARGVVRALSWFMKDRIRAFSEAELDAAYTFIGATADAEALGQAVLRLREQLAR